MILRLLILFTLVPLVELWLFLQLAKWTSIPFTILIVVLTGVLGTVMTRSQGLRALQNLKQQIATRRGVTDAILDAVMILVAGVLLITPGVLTDAFGFSLLIPWCRRWYRTLAAARIARRFQVDETPRHGDGSGANSRVIDSYVVPRQEELDQQG
ncbi:MAG: FxsA family protein [Planctomycetota bacterium]|nr:FxsA family protein [Planctomycetota bacterium]